jgi:quercetin dioxygenase-like cupin family protein
MKATVPVIVLAGILITGAAMAQTNAPAPILPETLRWVSPSNNPALQGAWVLGAEARPGPYLLRVKLAAGGRIPPHTHPDERITTVLSGTIYVGFGETFDETNAVAIPAGGVYVAPAGVPHFVWARGGNAVYQEAGVGPTATVFVRR